MIAQHLCPFAARPYADEDVLFEALPPDLAAALLAVYRRASQMSTAGVPATVLLIAASGLESFASFQDFQAAAETLLEEAFAGQFITASFHPAYTFAGHATRSSVHYLHRSPYPILQLLRQDQVAFAKTSVNLAALLGRNADVAESLGEGFFAQYLRP